MVVFLWILLALLVFIVLVAVHDVTQRRHAIMHNYPVIGHFRYWLEFIGPELRQYWVADDKEELPFNRSERSWIYATAKNQNNYFGFGTEEQLYGTGYPIIKNAAFPFSEHKATWPGDDPSAVPCLKIMGASHGRKRPYRPNSVVNISAMSFGALGKNAISALNLGAQLAHCYHNTGEGGVSPYHLLGADVVFQIGTGYFGARGADGNFSLDIVADKCARYPQIRAIEIKLSQGAKPGKGGVLPGAKVVPEIAHTRGIQPFQDCISPNAHSEFSDVDGMIDFIERVAARTGLPVGVKAAIGETGFWGTLAERMKLRGEGPDFITIDGGEGGTGAAPLTYTDHVSLPFKIGFARVYQLFQNAGVSKDVVWIGSAKLGFPDRAVVAFAMGCDMVNVAREAMMSIGCIQSQSCHTGHCPTGVTTMSEWRQAGLDVDDKSKRCANFIKGFRKELIALAHTAGYEHPAQFTGIDIELSTGINKFSTLESVLGYRADAAQFTKMRDLTPV
ncbi:MAG TPA: FMN-binding glutamate synthase family protein [Gammaproteobacteria bacterium]|nr:FMN-binding glutamate synthase family protein [Gammaproteobacteria bacterium]